jgi:hypothetical protein
MTATSSFEILLDHVADKPVLLATLARLIFAKGEYRHARALCARAIALAPDNAEVRSLAAEVLSHGVPDWYFPLVQDNARHQLYELAFRDAIRPGSRVLDIGSGTGLFALMAARAGAAEVVTCESNLAVAEVVSEIVARNGFSDRIRVIAKHSFDLEIGTDLKGPADVLVWDNLSATLIGAGALPTVERAVRRLVRPSASVIPARGSIRIALAEDRKAHYKRMSIVEGFDLTPFNQLAPPFYQLSNEKERVFLRSKPADLFCFDFRSGGPFPEARAAVTLFASGGTVNGIAQWVNLELDEKRGHEFPVARNTASGARFYPLMHPIELAAGVPLTICGAHDRMSLRIWAENRQM